MSDAYTDLMRMQENERRGERLKRNPDSFHDAEECNKRRWQRRDYLKRKLYSQERKVNKLLETIDLDDEKNLENLVV